jgi:hypothetical protein
MYIEYIYRLCTTTYSTYAYHSYSTVYEVLCIEIGYGN